MNNVSSIISNAFSAQNVLNLIPASVQTAVAAVAGFAMRQIQWFMGRDIPVAAINVTQPPAETIPSQSLTAEIQAQSSPQQKQPEEAKQNQVVSMEPPAVLKHGQNTCFLATIMWASFFNEPTIQQELRNAIQRLSTRELNAAEENKLEALLKLHMLVTSDDKVIDEQRMVGLREILHLCDPTRWNKNGTAQEDASEAYGTLIDTIYDGAVNTVKLHKTNIVIQGQHKLRKENGQDPGLGNLGTVMGNSAAVPGGLFPALNFDQSKSLRKFIDNEFIPSNMFSASYTVEGQIGKKEFQVRQESVLDSPPPLLTFHVKRYDNFSNKINDPIVVNEREVFQGRYFENGNAVYELSSVIMHLGETPTSGHYTALVKRGADWYLCNDTDEKGEVVKRLEKEEALMQAQKGYMFFYRRVDTAASHS